MVTSRPKKQRHTTGPRKATVPRARFITRKTGRADSRQYADRVSVNDAVVGGGRDEETAAHTTAARRLRTAKYKRSSSARLARFIAPPTAKGVASDIAHAGKGRRARAVASGGIRAVIWYVPFPINLVVLAIPVALIATLIVAALILAVSFAPVLLSGPTTELAATSAYQSGLSPDKQGHALSREESQEIQKALDEHSPELVACLADAPRVGGAAGTKLRVTKDEADQERDTEIERRRAASERLSQRPTTQPQARQRSQAIEAERKRRADFDGERELTTTGDPLVPPGAQVLDERGRVLPEYTSIINQVPRGTSIDAARAFLVVAFGGGTSSWRHFSAVVDERVAPGTSGLSSKDYPQVWFAFFDDGFDPNAYLDAANSQLIFRAADGSLISQDKSQIDDLVAPVVGCADKIKKK